MSSYATKAFRKTDDGNLEQFLFYTTAKAVGLHSYTPMTDDEISGTIPAITADSDMLEAVAILDAQNRKTKSMMITADDLATVATSGSYTDLKNKPTIPTKVSQLSNDTGFITGVTWNQVTGKPSTFTPADHTHGSDDVTALTGYTKAAQYNLLNDSDTLNDALGKLEAGLDNKYDIGDTVSEATKASQDANGKAITSYVASVTKNGSNITVTKGDNTSTTLTVSETDEKVKLTPSTTEIIYLAGTTKSAGETGTVKFDPNIHTTATPGELVASKFTGTLAGTASLSEAAKKLANSRSIILSGNVTGSGSFDGSADLEIATSISNIDASKVTSGVFSLARIPKAAISALKRVQTEEAMYALTTDDVQIGDTVKVTSTGQMYYVVDEANLDNAAGYEKYTADTASSVPWSGITNKPSTFTPSAHTQAASTITGLATVATSGSYSDLTDTPNIPSKTSELTNDSGYITGVSWGQVTGKPSTFTPAAHTHDAANDITGLAPVATTGSYADLTNTPTIPSKTSELTNDSGYITGVSWNQVTSKPSTFTPAAHNQASNTITTMAGYTKATANSAIATGDSLNAAIGKLEFALDGKLGVNATAEKANKDSVGNEINSTYIKNITASGKTVTFTKGDGSTGTFTTQDTTYNAATSSTLGLVKTGSNITNTSGTISLTKANVTNALGYTPPTSDTTYSAMTGATSSADGASGLVPTPTAGKQASFLRADGTWAIPTDTKYSAGTGIDLTGTTFSNAGVRSVSLGATNNQLKINTGGTETTITLNNVANATTANSLSTARTIALSGAVTGSVTFDGSANKTITTTLSNFDASKITSGTIDIARLPKAAIPELKIVADDTARFALTTSDIQNGDTVQVTSTGKMYYVKDQTKLSSEDGYAVYTAGAASSVPWSGVTGKPSSYTPSAHNQASNTITAMTGYAKASASSAIATTDSLNTAIGKLEYTVGTKLDSSGTAVKATSDANGQNIASTYIKSLSVSGKTVTYTKGDGTTGSFNTQDTNTTYSVMTGATADAAGASGLVPAPAKGAQTKYLRADGTWQTPPDTNTTYGAATSSTLGLVKVGSNITNSSGTISLTKSNVTDALGYTPPTTNTTYSVMGAATSDAAGSSGLVPAPAAGKQTSFLRGDGTWVVPTNTTYSAGAGIGLSGTTFSNTGVRSVAAGSSANQISVNTNGTTSTITVNNVANATKATQDSAGQQINTTYIKGLSVSGKVITYTKGDGTTGTITTQDTNTTYSTFKAATSDAAGGTGLVPAPAAGKQTSFLRGDGTWVVPTNTWTAFKGATSSAAGTAGYVPAPAAGDQAKFFRADGTWVVPANTTYSAGTGISLSGTTINNSGVHSVVAGSNANQISVNTNGTTSTITINNVANATSAGSATKATQDSAGQQINTTYIKGLSVSGTTITYTKGDGTTGTIKTQDTNTTYNFSGTTFYSGNQNTAEHDANNALKNGHYYYTTNGPATSLGASSNDGGLYVQSYSDTWVCQIAQDYRNGRLFVRGKNNGTWQSWLKVAVAGDIPSSLKNPNALTLSLNGTSQGAYDGSSAKSINITASSIGAAASSHTHNYAGSSSAGGAATKAVQDSDGQQINTTYIKGLSVSGKTITYTKGDGTTGTITTQDTNTTYSAFKGATSSAAGGAGLVPAPGAGAQAKYLRADGTWQTPPDTNTTYSASNGISLSGTTFSNSGVRAVTTGSTNGTISVNTNGTVNNIAVKGLGNAAYSNTSAFAAASHSHSNYALKTDIPSVWDADGHLVSPAGWKIWITNE